MKTLPGIVLVTAIAIACGMVLLSALRHAADLGARPDAFELGTAILVAGYLLFPALAFVAAGMLAAALMLLAAAVIERRRARPPL